MVISRGGGHRRLHPRRQQGLVRRRPRREGEIRPKGRHQRAGLGRHHHGAVRDRQPVGQSLQRQQSYPSLDRHELHPQGRLRDVWGEVSAGVDFVPTPLSSLRSTSPSARISTASAARPACALLGKYRHGVVAALCGAAGVTRQIVLPTSSATSSAPDLSIATPTGRPCASPASLKKPVRTSSGWPEGRPPSKGTKITL